MTLNDFNQLSFLHGTGHPAPLRLNLGAYNIRDGRIFGLPQEICAIEQSNYDLIILEDTKIPDGVYCHNRLGYDVVCSETIFTAAG